MKDFGSTLAQFGEVGFVTHVSQSLIEIEGLPGATQREMVVLETGQVGEVIGLRAASCEVLLFSNTSASTGVRVARLGKRMQIKVSDQLLSRVVNALGLPIEGDLPDTSKWEEREVDITAPEISKRSKVSKPLETGVTIVDTLVPLGRGQRELVMGDRKTGKSFLLLQTLVAQAKLGSVCIYATIGKKQAEIKRIQEFLVASGAGKSSVLVASSSYDAVGEIYLTPYTAMTIAEYFRDQGRDVLVLLDDMTTHAKFYREISLIGHRFPGRDSYPGDIFYTHSRLLERAGNFIYDGRQVAITCLPVAETAQGDFTGYIQTNLMSMTDGHVYFDSDLYAAGRRPAINPFVSVTRVGYQTMTKLRRGISQATMTLLSDYQKAQSFVRFGAELGDATRQTLQAGERMVRFFEQPMDIVVQINVQIVLWGLLWGNLWEGRDIIKAVQAYEADVNFRTLVNNIVVNSDSVETLEVAVKEKQEALMAPFVANIKENK